MFRKNFFLLLCFLTALSFACSTAEKTEDTNKPVNLIVDQSNLPPGFSTQPINTNGALTPGIPNPNNSNAVQKGATPTPGIPDPSTIGKTPMPKGTPPIPGIPDEETLKKQMSQPRNAADINKVPPAGPIGNSMKNPMNRKRSIPNRQ